MHVLVLNCGSSSVKYALFGPSGPALLRGRRERLVGLDPSLDAKTGTGVESGSDEGGMRGDASPAGPGGDPGTSMTHAAALREIMESLSGQPIDTVGHRVVHGGPDLFEPTVVSDSVIERIEAAASGAPLHNPYAAEAMRVVRELRPEVPQVACFDTAFHARMPRRATTYAIDHEVARAHDIRRYGFHGLSHEYVAGVAAGFLERPLDELRLVVLHLGNGASACAVEYGRSAETSMGATPLEGLVMGTRSGDVDAGALLKLLRNGFDIDALDDLLNRQSGLLGLSGVSEDLREIEAAAEAGDDRSRLAVNVFAHRARKYIGAYAAAMGGLDAIVFTGGIGENSATMRGRILQRLEFLGAHLDPDANQDASVRADNEHALITTSRSRVVALVVKSNEELMIARQTRALLRTDAPRAPMAVPIAVSARHCHLTAATFEALFGADRVPTPDTPLSQPGQFAAEERVTLIGPRGRIEGVRVLGPLRTADQVEISRTDEFRLGIDAPVRNSGNVAGSAPVRVVGPSGTVDLAEGLICARRHIHMHPDDAVRFGVADGDEVAVTITGGERDLVFGDVLIRVKESYRLEMHIDTDEANAAELGGGARGIVSASDLDAPDAATGAVVEAATTRDAAVDSGVDTVVDAEVETVYEAVEGAHAIIEERRPNRVLSAGGA